MTARDSTSNSLSRYSIASIETKIPRIGPPWVVGKIKSSPFYRLTGRNFLDDHKIYERFYPTVGVGVSNRILENFFYGINWEIARGLSLFGGWHYGKVRTFEKPGYIPGQTPVTPDEFEFYQKNKWKTETVVGAKLDILIIRNLVGPAAVSRP